MYVPRSISKYLRRIFHFYSITPDRDSEQDEEEQEEEDEEEEEEENEERKNIEDSETQALQQKEQINSKKKEFISSFTVHGLSRIFTGSSRAESFFWLTVVLVGIALSSFVIYGLIQKYYRYEIYTEVSAKVTNKKTFPSITFCDNDMMINNYFAYCGVPHNQPLKEGQYCHDKLKYPPAITNIIKRPGGGWSNGLFHVTRCDTWGSKFCANDTYLKSLTQHNHSCFVWNYRGDLHDTYSHAYLEFKVNQSSGRHFSHMAVIVHDPGVTELELTNRVVLEPGKTYLLQIKETLIKRLPHPFPSKCAHSVPGVIFGGKYTRRTCIESLNYVKMLKQCGDALDYPKRFMPADILRKYTRNETMKKTMQCMFMFSKSEVVGVDECPVPCEELELSVISSFHELSHKKKKKKKRKKKKKEKKARNKKRGDAETSKEDEEEDGEEQEECEFEEENEVKEKVYQVDIQYVNIDSYRIVEEKQLYSWDQIAGEVGGFLGLVIGASFISIIEIVLYLILCCI